MSDTPTNSTTPTSPMNMEVLTPRIDALRNSISKDFEKSGNRKAGRGKISIEGKDRDHRRALVEGLVTARRAEKPNRRSSCDESTGGFVTRNDFDSFKRTIEERIQALEEALEQKDDEIDALQKQLTAAGISQTPQAANNDAAPAAATTKAPVSGIPALNLSSPSSPGIKKPPKPPPSPIVSPVSSSPKNTSEAASALTLNLAGWETEETALLLGQLGVFKLWTASMTCKAWRTVACTVVLQQKRDQLRSGADPALKHYEENPDDTDGLIKLLPPLFQSGGPYHTLGMAGFVKIQELLKNEGLELKDLYKFMRDITRRK